MPVFNGPQDPPAKPRQLLPLRGRAHPFNWGKRSKLWLLVGLIALIGGVFLALRMNRQHQALLTYATQPVLKGSLTLNVSANGTLQPTRLIGITSELIGTVQSVSVDVNDKVKKGQVLAELDTGKLADQVARARAALAAAQAQWAQTRATVKENEARLARLEEVSRLSGGKVPSAAELDSARAALYRSAAAESSAKANIDAAKASLASDETYQTKATIRSPIDGIVLARNIDQGNAVAGTSSTAPLFTLAEHLNRLQLQVHVGEADIGRVKIGQVASFAVSAFPGRRFQATITRVAFGATLTDNGVTYQTLMEVNNDDLSLRPGMTATAKIIELERKEVLMVPNEAFNYTPTPQVRTNTSMGVNGQATTATASDAASAPRKLQSVSPSNQIWILRGGKPVAVNVTPGISDGHMTEVSSTELVEGQLVITDQRTSPATPIKP